MQWIDVVAGVVSRRHSGMETRTAAVDHLEFLAPAHINDTVTLQGRVTYVGNTSMEVCVDTYVEHLECPHDRSRVNRAYLTMVAAPDAFPVRRLFFSGQSLVFSRRMKRMGVPSKPKLLRR